MDWDWARKFAWSRSECIARRRRATCSPDFTGIATPGGVATNGQSGSATLTALPFRVLPDPHRPMKISALFSFWMGIVFTLLALAMALSNLSSGDVNAPEAEVAAAHGYAIFWFFLAAFGIVMVAVSWLMLKGKLGGDME